MLAARDEQSGQSMDAGQIQDEIIMLLVMGHMTAAVPRAEVLGRARRLARGLAASGVAPGARHVLASGARMAELLAHRGDLPEVRSWAQLDGPPAGPGVTPLAELLQRGDAATAPDLETLVRQRRPEEPAALLYTPGTTGEPKAVELTHGNLDPGLAPAVRRLHRRRRRAHPRGDAPPPGHPRKVCRRDRAPLHRERRAGLNRIDGLMERSRT